MSDSEFPINPFDDALPDDAVELPYSVVLDSCEVRKYFANPNHWMHSVRSALLLHVPRSDTFVLYVLDNRRPDGEFADAAPFWLRPGRVPGSHVRPVEEDDYDLAVEMIERGGGALAIHNYDELYRDEKLFPSKM